MPVWLDVNPHSGVPLYLQIMEQVKHALTVGSLQPGDHLPTVRQLAGELTIAPNTIVKAYTELQRMGLIESRAGVGTIVTHNSLQTTRQQQIEAVFERLRVLVRDAHSLGIDAAELRACFEAEYERLLSESLPSKETP
jgi:GntR family transcriptional regulator